MDRLVGLLLRTGVTIAAAIVLAGGVIFLLQHGSGPWGMTEFRGEPARLRHVGEIIPGALQVRGRALIQLGILCLIATPVLRVVFLVGAFARQRDRLYVAVALIVLAVLAYSILLGR